MFLVLVRQALRGGSAAEVVTGSLGDNDWKSVFQLTKAHGLMAFLGIRLRPTGFAGLPPWFADRLEQHARVNSLRNRMLLQEYRTLCEALRTSGIAPVALKGIAFIQGMYDDPGLRELADIDFLVDESQLNAARGIIEEHGYRPVFSAGMLADGEANLTPGQKRVYEAFYHAYSFQSADDLINVDLHWRLAPAIFPNPLPTRFAPGSALTAAGGASAVLTAPLQLVCQCMHAAKDGWSELKWAVDITYAMRQLDETAWNEAWRLATQFRARRMLLTGLAITAWLAGSEPVSNTLWAESRFRPARGVLRNIQKRLLDDPDRKFRQVPCLGLNKTYMSLCDSPADALSHAGRKLTMAEPGDFARLGLRPALLPVWPLLRPFVLSADCLRRAIRHVMAHPARVS